jgi:hypothetical protein
VRWLVTHCSDAISRIVDEFEPLPPADRSHAAPLRPRMPVRKGTPP